MVKEYFDQHVTHAHERLNELVQQAQTLPESSTVLREALEELASSLEELHVAGEELQVQNEELVATRDAAETERRRYQELFEFAPDGYLVTDAAGQILEANQAATALFAFAKDELLRLPLSVLVAQQDQERFHALLHDLSRGAAIPAIELRMASSRRPPFPAALTIAPVTGVRRVTGLRWAIRDITERWQMEDALREANETLERRVDERTAALQQTALELHHTMAELDATITSIADGVMVFTADGHLARMNPAAEAILGYNLAELTVPGRLLRLVRPETIDGQSLSQKEMPVVRALRGEKVINHLMLIHHADGRKAWVSTSAAPIYAEGNPISGAVLTFTDITRIREAQQRQEEFVSIVSHDLRIPLTVIKGHIQMVAHLVKTHEIDGELDTSISAIERGATRMDIMIRDLVDMTRLESEQLTLHSEPVKLEPYIGNLLARLAGTLDVNRIMYEGPADLPPVRADDNRLERILINLLTNAFKYSAPGTPIHLTARHANGEVEISVRDHGRGIVPQNLPHLFDRFYRVKGSERQAEGIGLGLYITRMLVEAHGGRIRGESTPGEGSTFYFTLPAAVDIGADVPVNDNMLT